MNKKLTDKEKFAIEMLKMIAESNKTIEETSKIIEGTSKIIEGTNKKIKKLMDEVLKTTPPAPQQQIVSLRLTIEAARSLKNNQN